MSKFDWLDNILKNFTTNHHFELRNPALYPQMDFKNGVENIQAAAYNGARTVLKFSKFIHWIRKQKWFGKFLPIVNNKKLYLENTVANYAALKICF